jgi:rubredoxin
MDHKGQESSSRKLVWVEGLRVAGWGCSECAWVFNPSGPPIGRSLDEITRKIQAQLSQEFAAHDCAEFPRAKGATPSS